MATRPDHGPNYPTPAAEAKATRKQSTVSWFDACAATLLIVCVALIPVLWVLGVCGRLVVSA